MSILRGARLNSRGRNIKVKSDKGKCCVRAQIQQHHNVAKRLMMTSRQYLYICSICQQKQEAVLHQSTPPLHQQIQTEENSLSFT